MGSQVQEQKYGCRYRIASAQIRNGSVTRASQYLDFLVRAAGSVSGKSLRTYIRSIGKMPFPAGELFLEPMSVSTAMCRYIRQSRTKNAFVLSLLLRYSYIDAQYEIYKGSILGPSQE